MARSAEIAAREAEIAGLKRLITSRRYETIELLEEAVDAYLWSEHDRRQADQELGLHEIARTHPK
jgi:hypothetical protein